MTTNVHFPILLSRNRSVVSSQNTSEEGYSIADMNGILRLLRMEHIVVRMNAHFHKHRSIVNNNTVMQILICETQLSYVANTRQTVVRGDEILGVNERTSDYSSTLGRILLIIRLQTHSPFTEIGKHIICVVLFIVFQLLHRLLR